MAASKNTRKSCGSGRMNAASTTMGATMDANAAFAERARRIGAKELARTLRTSWRTTENWLAGRAGPNWKHVAGMLADDHLACEVLRAAGREDLAELVEARGHAAELAALLRRVAGSGGA